MPELRIVELVKKNLWPHYVLISINLVLVRTTSIDYGFETEKIVKRQANDDSGTASGNNCPAGTEGSACQPCLENFYSTGGLDECIACPANSTSPSGSTSADDCICDPGYEKLNGVCSISQCAIYKEPPVKKKSDYIRPSNSRNPNKFSFLAF